MSYFNLSVWDIALLTIIPVQATLLAYIHRPQMKAILSIIPLPFTLATLSLGRPIDGTNIAGILLLIVFIHSVRIITYSFRFHVIFAIVFAACAYCLAGSLLARVVPHTDMMFWIITVVSFFLGIILNVLTPNIEEPGHRSPIPVLLKWFIITCVVFVLIIIKKQLLGFMTLFPMVGVVASYEMRFSLWTYCRNVHFFIIAAIPMMIAIRLTQERFGLGTALVFGWVVLLIIAVPFYMVTWKKTVLETS